MYLMKVVFDNIVFSLQKSGGISVVWYELLSRMLKNLGGDLRFIEYSLGQNNPFRKKCDIPASQIIIKNTRSLPVCRYWSVHLRSISEPFIFHSSYYRFCKNTSAKNVTTVHDFTYEYYRTGFAKKIHCWQKYRAIKHSEAIVCISNNTKLDLMKFVPNIDPHKVHVIYNGVSEDYKVITDKINGLQKHLLFVGMRDGYKNGMWLAEAIKETEYKMIFCGSPMTDNEKIYYDNMLGAERYEVKVRISNEELNQYYNSVYCLVYPSSYEGFGIPVLEAQRAGCPVIALNASSIPEVIGDTPLLMQELTKEELLKKLILLEDFRVRQKVINDGLENSKRFSWDKTYEQYKKLYESLLK